ncbi:MAG: LptF/LptG family permease [Phycisphaerae bacterium]
MSILTRYILRSLTINYLIALSAMISLYIVLDMFVNMDEFTEHGYGTLTVLGNIAGYYGPNMFLHFAQLSGAITLFACMATIARMRKRNELTAVLSSGVSLHRLAVPVIGFGVATSALLAIDTEIVIPHIADRLARDHDDIDGRRAYEVLFLPDRDDALFSADSFSPTTGVIHRLLVLQRDAAGAITGFIEADRAEWQPPDPAYPTGAWRLERGRHTVRTHAADGGLGPRSRKTVTPIALYASELTPKDIQLRQSEHWMAFLSLAELRELERHHVRSPAKIIQTRHARITAPILGVVLLLLGLPFFLDRSPVNVLSDGGKCLVACGVCYVASFVVQRVQGDATSALPAWIPIFAFAPIAVVLIDRIRT